MAEAGLRQNNKEYNRKSCPGGAPPPQFSRAGGPELPEPPGRPDQPDQPDQPDRADSSNLPGPARFVDRRSSPVLLHCPSELTRAGASQTCGKGNGESAEGHRLVARLVLVLF